MAERAFRLRDGMPLADSPAARALNKARPEALYRAPVKTVTGAAGNAAFWPG